MRQRTLAEEGFEGYQRDIRGISEGYQRDIRGISGTDHSFFAYFTKEATSEKRGLSLIHSLFTHYSLLIHSLFTYVKSIKNGVIKKCERASRSCGW